MIVLSMLGRARRAAAELIVAAVESEPGDATVIPFPERSPERIRLRDQLPPHLRAAFDECFDRRDDHDGRNLSWPEI